MDDEEDERDGGENADYEEESVELPMNCQCPRYRLFICEFFLAKALWIPSN